MYKSKTHNYAENLNYGASEEIVKKARDLRKKMTPAEKIVWDKLRDKRLGGFKFRRQHPIWRFIADFYCHEVKIVVEIDGGIHQDRLMKEYDASRSAELERMGIKVLRYLNEDVYENIERILSEIENECKKRALEFQGE